jgi:hypothetical protein
MFVPASFLLPAASVVCRAPSARPPPPFFAHHFREDRPFGMRMGQAQTPPRPTAPFRNPLGRPWDHATKAQGMPIWSALTSTIRVGTGDFPRVGMRIGGDCPGQDITPWDNGEAEKPGACNGRDALISGSEELPENAESGPPDIRTQRGNFLDNQGESRDRDAAAQPLISAVEVLRIKTILQKNKSPI